MTVAGVFARAVQFLKKRIHKNSSNITGHGPSWNFWVMMCLCHGRQWRVACFLWFDPQKAKWFWFSCWQIFDQQLIIHLCAGLKWNRHIEWVCPGRSWEMFPWFHVLSFYCCFDLCSQSSLDFIAGMVGNVSADAWACSSWGAWWPDGHGRWCDVLARWCQSTLYHMLTLRR